MSAISEARVRQDRKRGATLPDRFTPRFWSDADGRSALVKEIKRRVQLLKGDAGADNYQKSLLCERVVFLVCQVESLELTVIEGGSFEAGKYAILTNTLLGCLRTLGLESKVRAGGLKAHLANRSKSA